MLSQTCEYALRAMTYIAQHGDGRHVLAKEIAGDTAVPLKYLQKILRDLVRAGVLHSSRGIGGGFRLSRPARHLRLADVVGPFDDTLRRPTCPFGNPLCGKANPCPVHRRWSRVVESYTGFLERTTLHHLVEQGSKAPKAKKKTKRRPVRR